MNAITTLEPVQAFGSYPKIAEKVIAFVLDSFAEEISLEDLAREAGMSRFNFCRRFHKECGLPPMRWLWNFRTQLAAEFIQLDPRWSLTDIAFSCGFTSSAHFSRSFKAAFGKSPSQFKKEAVAAEKTAPEDAATANFDGVFGDNKQVVLKACTKAMTIV